MRVQRRDILSVFLVTACLGTLLTSGNIRSADYVVAFSVARNILSDGSLQATPIEGFETWAVSTGPDGKPYCRYGLGHSLLGIPAQLAGSIAASSFHGSTAFLDLPRIRFYDWKDRVTALAGMFGALTNNLVIGLLAVAVLLLSRSLGLSIARSRAAALVAGAGSPLMFQASDFTAEPASALCLVLAGLVLVRTEQVPWKATNAFLFGAAAGASVLFKVAHGVLLVPAAASLLVVSRGPVRAGKGLGAFAAGTSIALILVAAYNILRFETPFETGYGAYATAFTNPFAEGALGQLLSPGRGVFLYFPLVLAAIPGAARTRHGAYVVFSWGSLAALWLLYSPWFAWEGGWTYGPRLLSPALPLLVPLAMNAFDTGRSVVSRMVELALISWSFLFSALGFAVDYIDYGFYLWKAYGEAPIEAAVAGGLLHVTLPAATMAARWDPSAAPLAAYWTFPEKRELLLQRCLAGDAPGFVCLVFIAAAVGLGIGLYVILRRGAGDHRSRP